jgi:MYXO-CTERM domain-containing protein
LFYTFQRTGNWAVDINDGYTPEPAAAWLTLAGLGFLARYRRRRKE